MKVTMTIPTYWGRASKQGWRAGDAIYDHPTPVDGDGTLLRTLQSIRTLEDTDFQLVVIAVPTAEDIEIDVETKVASIIETAGVAVGVEMLLFGPSNLKQIHHQLIRAGKKKYLDLLKLRGYPNIRNLCMFIPHILGSDVAVLIDDDEVFEDPAFMSKAKAFIGKATGGHAVNAVAGYYLQPDGDYHLKKSIRPWMKHWDQYERMNEAFDQIIGTEPRLKETPFVFGGNMVIQRDLFTVVPFDPYVPRGEDIDFLMNAKMFGFTFFLDNQLSIKHLPPPKTHPTWRQLREDIYRFLYERSKLEHQHTIPGMTRVSSRDFDPYPGCFLKSDLEEKIEKACKLLSEEYLAQGDQEGSHESLQNVSLAKTDATPKHNPFENLRQIQSRWQELMEYTNQHAVVSTLREAIR